MTNTPVTSRLLEPATLGRLNLPNRLVMAPLTRNRAGADGVPGTLMSTYYAQRAGAGLIIAEAAAPNPVGQTYPNIPAIHNAAQVAGWRRVTEAVRQAGGRMFLQLQHGGRVGHPDNSGLVPIAPSPIPLPETIHTPSGKQPSVVPREMSVHDIQSTIADFAAAARNAIAAGFEGVEVHAANGHLLHQFMASNSNRRNDAYGGSVEHRIRFAVEVVRAVAQAIGPQRVGVRISPEVFSTGYGRTTPRRSTRLWSRHSTELIRGGVNQPASKTARAAPPQPGPTSPTSTSCSPIRTNHCSRVSGSFGRAH